MIAQLKADDPRDIEAVLLTAARLVRVRVKNLRPDSHRANACLFVLRPLYATDWKAKYHLEGEEHPPYTRLNHRLTHTVCAVCWHGHRDFFRTVFEIIPEITFRTAVATYKGSEDFEEKYLETGYKDIGSQMEPCWMATACYCEEGVC